MLKCVMINKINNIENQESNHNLSNSNDYDVNSEFVRILDALKKYGPRNLSLIAMLTGLPKETVRYKVKKQLKSMGFMIKTVPHYYRMGLERFFGIVSFTRNGNKYAQEILDWLGVNSYLSYYGKIAFSNKYIVMLSPPTKWSSELIDMFEELATRDIIAEYDFKEIVEVGYPHVSYRLFDFKKCEWKLDGDFEYNADVISLQRISQKEAANYVVDSLDLAIIAELHIDAFKPLTEVATQYGKDPRLLRYHFQEHIVRKGLIAGYLLTWYPKGERSLDIARWWVSFGPRSEKELSKLRKMVSSSPFCKSYQVASDGSFISYMIAEKQLIGAINNLSKKLEEEGIFGEPVLEQDGANFTITKELFTNATGWLRPPKIPLINIIKDEVKHKHLNLF